MSYYSPGDAVIYTPTNSNAKVIRHVGSDNYLVEFEDKDLIPPQMEVPERFLKPQPLVSGMYGFMDWSGDYYKPKHNKETHCPKCGTPWKETIIFRNTYYDCLKCNLKKEDA